MRYFWRLWPHEHRWRDPDGVWAVRGERNFAEVYEMDFASGQRVRMYGTCRRCGRKQPHWTDTINHFVTRNSGS